MKSFRFYWSFVIVWFAFYRHTMQSIEIRKGLPDIDGTVSRYLFIQSFKFLTFPPHTLTFWERIVSKSYYYFATQQFDLNRTFWSFFIGSHNIHFNQMTSRSRWITIIIMKIDWGCRINIFIFVQISASLSMWNSTIKSILPIAYRIPIRSSATV